MAIIVTTLTTISLGNKVGRLIKVKGDGSTTEVSSGLSHLDAVVLAGNVDDTAAIVDAVISTTDSSKFDTAVDATNTAIASGKYRTFLCIGSA